MPNIEVKDVVLFRFCDVLLQLMFSLIIILFQDWNQSDQEISAVLLL